MKTEFQTQETLQSASHTEILTPPDHDAPERINALYKAELIYRNGPWKSAEAVELATLKWVSWFNEKRLLEPIGNVPPAEAEANYYHSLGEQAQAA